MNRRLLPAMAVVGSLWAHDPVTTKLTWTQEITRIVNRRCVGCHAEFKRYETARPWAKAIRDEVESRRMPPWGAVKGVGDFAGDPSLSGPEIEMLVAWVEGGAPEGDPVYLPNSVPPPALAVGLPRFSRAVAVQRELTLERPGAVVAVRPRASQDHVSMEAWAVRPDGTIDRFLWLPDYRKAGARNYVLREAALLPAGTRLRVEAGATAAITFYLK